MLVMDARASRKIISSSASTRLFLARSRTAGRGGNAASVIFPWLVVEFVRQDFLYPSNAVICCCKRSKQLFVPSPDVFACGLLAGDREELCLDLAPGSGFFLSKRFTPSEKICQKHHLKISENFVSPVSSVQSITDPSELSQSDFISLV